MSRILGANENVAITRLQLSLIPSVSVLAGSMITLMPIISQAPVLPPLGFMIFLSWRLLRPEIWPMWAGLPFGLFDDLMSGNPIGTGMILWTMVMIGFDLADNRMIWRDYWMDWVVATGVLASYIIAAMALSVFVAGGWTFMPLISQIAIAALFVPVTMRLCAKLDRWRLSL